MDAKDTVMTEEQVLRAYEDDNSADDFAIGLVQVAKAQAKISFKTGREQERERIIQFLKLRWRQYEGNLLDGTSIHTFSLAEDWQKELREGVVPFIEGWKVYPNAGKQEGRKEVVEFIRETGYAQKKYYGDNDSSQDFFEVQFPWESWQAKLKEWGIGKER